MSAVTQWFSPMQKPVHAGIYEMENLPYPFLYFDGSDWYGALRSPADFTPDILPKMGRAYGYVDRLRWRGLAEKPA